MLQSLSALALAITMAGSALPPDSTQRAELLGALEVFGQAFAQADAAALDTLLSPGYVHTNGGSGSVLTKDSWLAYIKTRRAELKSGALRVTRYDVEGLSIRWYPGLAVVTAEVVSEGIRNGKPFDGRLRVTQTWVRQHDRWLRAAFHDSPIASRAR